MVSTQGSSYEIYSPPIFEDRCHLSLRSQRSNFFIRCSSSSIFLVIWGYFVRQASGSSCNQVQPQKERTDYSGRVKLTNCQDRHFCIFKPIRGRGINILPAGLYKSTVCLSPFFQSFPTCYFSSFMFNVFALCLSGIITFCFISSTISIFF